ncbi:electron transport complex subunit RsxC [Shewanella khirikhana]|uniref:Ion-translocating oxidoreductase complex subunit C n=1 Tax=Shewanella khirikhana TaxID=1965282 RepID=A0ABM7DAJ6_9GAMM|nr:electron transport complex subunit RsxC [Shewanella khirikhana]AZQ10631.1 Electron transport complex protein RnfC [Shewanella khirikhana]
MLTLLEQLDKGTLWRSPGGIHPPEMKTLSSGTPIARLPLFNEYLIPLPQVGEQATLAVNPGDKVLKGQVLTRGQGFGYLPVHAPTSGQVKAIEAHPSNHASGLPVLSLVLESDGEDSWCELNPAAVDSLSPAEMVKKVQEAGIAGMGGAAFPSHIKLSPASDIELVIVNGVECEPYITADDRLIREHADAILGGAEIVHRILGPKRIIIAIEDNKPEAADAVRAAISRSHLPAGTARVTVVPTKYPSGGEKQLIQIVTGQEVPSGAIPAQLGILVHNVGTLFAIRDAVIDGKPLIERVVTVTGNAVSKPGNYWALIGTQVQDVLEHCDFRAAEAQKVIMGGPMMGYTLPSTQVPLLKGSNCILAPNGLEITEMPPEKPCIRCGECAVVCPAMLLPQQLFWHAKAEEYDKAESYNLKDCIECGCCSYVCPSDIPLVEYYRVAKAAIRQQADEKQKAERAKVRFEARLARLEEEKAAREAKAKEAADKRKASMAGNEKDAIAAALARVQAKKAAATQETDMSAAQSAVSANTAASGDKDPKAGVAAAIARAKAKKAAQAQAQAQDNVASSSDDVVDVAAADNPETAADPKKAAVAAAIARAKAKKAAQAQGSAAIGSHDTSDVAVNAAKATPQAPEETPTDPKKAAVAAAIARAKAKKAAQVQGSVATSADDTADVAVETAEAVPAEPHEATPVEPQEAAAVDPKKAAVAAAIAKAKAKKAAQAKAAEKQSADNGSDVQTDSEPSDASQPESNDTKPEAETAAAQTTPEQASEPMSADELKKARIAAAVAKAKAKKTAREQD